jgi:starch phosphorylase
MDREKTLAGARNGYIFGVTVPADRPVGDYTLRVIPFHEAVKVPLEYHRNLWQR